MIRNRFCMPGPILVLCVGVQGVFITLCAQSFKKIPPAVFLQEGQDRG